MDDGIVRDLGEQPLVGVMADCGLSVHDVVAASRILSALSYFCGSTNPLHDLLLETLMIHEVFFIESFVLLGILGFNLSMRFSGKKGC